jgi:hypothetical protein
VISLCPETDLPQGNAEEEMREAGGGDWFMHGKNSKRLGLEDHAAENARSAVKMRTFHARPR